MLAALRAFFLSHATPATYWIAYSGGLDSHVLLSLCHALSDTLPLKLQVIHVHHGLSVNADAWALHCARICKELNVVLTIKHVQLNLQAGESIEAKARDARYAVFADIMQPNDVLLTAHQENDQAETYLLQLLRGAGLKGLAAMPALKPFAKGFHARPLLGFNRAELEAYAKASALQWIEDESNHNTQLTRNFIRQTVIPILTAHWPSATTTIARSAAHAAEAQLLLEEFARDLCMASVGSQENTLSVKKILSYDETKQRLLLRTWIHQQHYALPNAAKLNSILNDVLTAAWDRTPCVAWQAVELRRYRDDLYLMPALIQHDVQDHYEWQFAQPLKLNNIGELTAEIKQGAGLRDDIKNISIRFRQGGETIDLGARGNHTLKNLFQEWNVLPWERDRIPLLFVGETLVAVVNYFIHADYAANENEQGWEIVLTK